LRGVCQPPSAQLQLFQQPVLLQGSGYSGDTEGICWHQPVLWFFRPALLQLHCHAANACAYACAYAHAHGSTYAHAYTHANSHAHSSTYAHANSHAHCGAYAHANAHANSHAHCGAYAHANAHANSCSNSCSNAITHEPVFCWHVFQRGYHGWQQDMHQLCPGQVLVL
jgi:hypothetical protein